MYELKRLLREKKILFTGIAVACLFLTVMARITAEDLGISYISDNGVITGIKVEREGSYPMKVSVRDGKHELRSDVILKMEHNAADSRLKQISPDERLRFELDGLIREISKDDIRAGDTVELPQETEEGAKIVWESPGGNHRWSIPLLIPPLITVYMWRGEKDRERRKALREKSEVLRALPGFCNKLLMMLESGLVFSDAFARVAETYIKHGGGDAFAALMGRTLNGAEALNDDASAALGREAAKLQIRELTRICRIIVDNQYKGTDFREKLRAESILLWSGRKSRAEERGKLAETRMSFPLAIMLAVLVFITAAPAMLRI